MRAFGTWIALPRGCADGSTPNTLAIAPAYLGSLASTPFAGVFFRYLVRLLSRRYVHPSRPPRSRFLANDDLDIPIQCRKEAYQSFDGESLRRSTASLNPRSANTLPELGVTFSRLLFALAISILIPILTGNGFTRRSSSQSAFSHSSTIPFNSSAFAGA